jgi:endonuclease G, mitochondrial
MKRILIIIGLAISLNALEISDFIDLKKCDQIIDKQVFKICYSYEHKGALAVWYELDGKLVNKTNIKKRPSFYNEKTIPMKYRSKSKDYTKTGLDRGHLANDASFDYDKKIVRKTYTMANVIPQYPKVNRYTWIKAERYERQIAVKLEKVTVINLVDYSNSNKVIGKNKVSVPTSFSKILFNNYADFSKCFQYQNIKDIDTKKDKLKQHLINCNI